MAKAKQPNVHLVSWSGGSFSFEKDDIGLPSPKERISTALSNGFTIVGYQVVTLPNGTISNNVLMVRE